MLGKKAKLPKTGFPKIFFEKSLGQVAVEYLVLFAFLLLVVGIFFAYSIVTVNDSVAIHRTRDSLLKLSSAAENIYALGEGSRTTADIELPSGVKSFEAKENYLKISISLSGGISEFSELSNASFSYANLPTGEGPHKLLLEVQDGNVVITEV